MSTKDLREQIVKMRAELGALEAKLRFEEQEETGRWYPEGFYTAYYLLGGLLLGVLAAWCVLALNVVGAYLMGEDPLALLRVYATILGGERAAESSEAVVLVFALGVHTITGAICGAPIHLFYSRFRVDQGILGRLLVGVVLGVVMWVVNYYLVLTWLQPLLTGEEGSYIVEHTPIWVAIANHVAFTTILLLLQPFGMFNARSYSQEEPPAQPSAATDTA